MIGPQQEGAFSVVIPARVLQPGVQHAEIRNGLSLSAATGWRSRRAITFTCCVSHRWRTSTLLTPSVRTGSGDP